MAPIQHMTKHKFGGSWTQRKLEIVRDYLGRYTTIMEKNTNARYFHRWYVDAFAGTGSRIDSGADSETREYLKGSATIALEVEPSFHEFLFIEQDPVKSAELGKVVESYPQRRSRVHIVQGDANQELMRWIDSLDWTSNRAVVFLDPYGMQVQWRTIEAIANTKGIDLWLLFPYSLLNRLLTNNALPPNEWCKKLNLIFGTDEWMQSFYAKVEDDTLFGVEEATIKQASLEHLKQFIVRRLHSIFVAVSENPLELLNSRNSPLFLLCFAAGNEKGSKPALRIANHLLKNANG